MKNTSFKSLIAGLIIISFTACNDNSEKPNVDQTFTKKLKGSKWQITSMVADSTREINGNSSRNWFSLFKDCRKDNIYTFGESENTISVAIDEGNLKCNNKEPIVVEPAFLFTSVNTSLMILNGHSMPSEGSVRKMFDTPEYEDNEVGIDQEWRIEKISEDTLTLTIQIKKEFDYIEFTAGTPTIKVEMKRYK